MSSAAQIQQPIALRQEKQYACDFLGCTERFGRRSDANRHYHHKHNADLHAYCPVCQKMISDARKDKQKEHMTKMHPYAVPVNQAWTKIGVAQQALQAAPATPVSGLSSMPSASSGATDTVLQPLAIYSTFDAHWSHAALEAPDASSVLNSIERQHLSQDVPNLMLQRSNPQSSMRIETATNIHASSTSESSRGSSIPQFISMITSPFRSESGHTVMWNADSTEDISKMQDGFNQVFEWPAENHASGTSNNE